MYFQVKNTLKNNIYYYLKQTLILLAQYILCFNLKPRSVSDSSKYHVFQVTHDVGSGLTTPIIIVIYIYIKELYQRRNNITSNSYRRREYMRRPGLVVRCKLRPFLLPLQNKNN
jgi:hypothetical protein